MEIWEAMRFGVMVHKALQGDYSAIRKLAEENRSRARYGWPSVKDELKALADNPEAQDAMKEMAEENPKIKEELKAMAEDQEDPTRIFDKIKKNIEKVESIEVDVTRRRVTKTMLEVFREMVEVEHVLADYGYTIIARKKIKNFAEFKNYFDKELADFIKETLRYDDAQFDEFLLDICNFKLPNGDLSLSLADWSYINKMKYLDEKRNKIDEDKR